MCVHSDVYVDGFNRALAAAVGMTMTAAVEGTGPDDCTGEIAALPMKTTAFEAPQPVDLSQELADAAYGKATDVCHYCLTVHAEASVQENFEDSRGFSLYDLPEWADAPVGVVRWDTITRSTRYAEANAYLIGVAADYLRNGDVTCECGR